MPQFAVVCGNIGQVAEGNNPIFVGAKFFKYVRLSKTGVGRVAGEPVTMFKDNEIMREYAPQEDHSGDS